MGIITEKVNTLMASKIRQSPVHTNRASQIGHECERFLTYERTRWEEKSLHDIGLQKVFEGGNLFERDTLRLLDEAGFELENQQQAFTIRQSNISGHIDGKIRLEDGASFVPFEVKSCSPYVFDSIDCLEDLQNHKYMHVRRYPAQVNIYLYMGNSETGQMVLRNRNNYDIKDFPIDLDYAYCETLLQKAERIEGHVKAGTLPDRIPYEDEGCGSCAYLHICIPEADRKGFDLLDDPELIEQLDEWFELKPSKSRYDAIDKIIKKKLKEKASVLLGDYHITGKEVAKKGYTVEAGSYWKTTIKKV